MKIYLKTFGLFFLCLSFNAQAQNDLQVRPDWEKVFREFEARGTIVIFDDREGAHQTLVYNKDRAAKQYTPASTFKIPHTLMALDAGVVSDEFQVFKWDGVERDYKPHNQDQTLRSAMRHSVVWVYQLFAREIGHDKASKYISQIQYGNMDITSKTGSYWLEGNLTINAYEQISFLNKLYRNELPFLVEHQRLTKDVMISEAGQNWILRAKTGWDGKTGWWVGWVEWSTGPVFFALNIDTPNRFDDLFKRQAITKEILRSIKALPAL